MKKNILTLLTSSYGGGAEKLVLTQMQTYNKEKFNLHVITFRKGQLEEEFKNTLSTYSSLNTKLKFSLAAVLKLDCYIKKNNIQLLHVHLIEPEIYSVPLRILNPRLKVIITKHNANDFRKKGGWRIINKIISLFADKIICVSEEIKRFSIKYEFVNKKKVVVCANGIDTTEVKRIKDDTKLRKKLGLKADDFVIGIIGRLTPQKGHIFLIRAVELLKQKIPNLKVLVIGDGELKEVLVEEVTRRGIRDRIKFLGFRHDAREIYSAMDVFCMPSLWEGLSIVLLEALSTESLVIMSDLPNNIEVAQPDKEGVYFKRGDSLELANKILYYYQHPEKSASIKKNARKRILKDFDWINNLKKIEDIYEVLLS